MLDCAVVQMLYIKSFYLMFLRDCANPFIVGVATLRHAHDEMTSNLVCSRTVPESGFGFLTSTSTVPFNLSSTCWFISSPLMLQRTVREINHGSTGIQHKWLNHGASVFTIHVVVAGSDIKL